MTMTTTTDTGSEGYYGIYKGIVVNNNDPEGLCRITAIVPQVFGNNTTATGWALPWFPVGWGALLEWAADALPNYNGPLSTGIPATETGVWICFEGGDVNYPVWAGVWTIGSNTAGGSTNGSSSGGGSVSAIITAPTQKKTVAVTQTIDASLYQFFDYTMTANTVFTIINMVVGSSIVVKLRGPFAPSWPTTAWEPNVPLYVDSTLYQFLQTETGEVQGTAVVEVPTNTLLGLFTGAGQLPIGNGAGTGELLAAPTEIGQSLVMEGSDASTVQWGYTRSLRDRYFAPTGVLEETIDQMRINGAVAIGTTGLVNFYPIALPKGLTIGHIFFRAAGTAATTPTHWWYALADASLNALALTADQTTTPFTASTDHPLPIATIASGASTTFKTTYEGFYYLGIQMTSSGQPSLGGFGLSSGGVSNIGSPRLLGVSSDAASTTPPTFPHTFGAIGGTLVGIAYGGVS